MFDAGSFIFGVAVGWATFIVLSILARDYLGTEIRAKQEAMIAEKIEKDARSVKENLNKKVKKSGRS